MERRKKKITVILSYDYPENPVASNHRIATRIEDSLRRGLDRKHETIEDITVEDT